LLEPDDSFAVGLRVVMYLMPGERRWVAVGFVVFLMFDITTS
jgi:phosphatidylglycerophosphatase A